MIGLSRVKVTAFYAYSPKTPIPRAKFRRRTSSQHSVELNKFCTVFENDALDNSTDVNRTRDSLKLYNPAYFHDRCFDCASEGLKTYVRC
jgi:hypothetical protein